MGNTFPLPIVRLFQRISMIMTLCCVAYVLFFLLIKNKEAVVAQNTNAKGVKVIDLNSPSPVFDIKPLDDLISAQARDIFSLTAPTAPSAAVATPKGQLPANLKVVAVLVGKPSQIVIEDTSANTSYFVDENNPQGGIKIVKVDQGEMTINFQGQDITVPISKN